MSKEFDDLYKEWIKKQVEIIYEPKDPRLGWDELVETVSNIIEIFEDFLERKGIVIDDPEKKQSGDNAANIYGTDYGELQSNLELIFVDRGLVTQEIIDKFK